MRKTECRVESGGQEEYIRENAKTWEKPQDGKHPEEEQYKEKQIEGNSEKKKTKIMQKLV